MQMHTEREGSISGIHPKSCHSSPRIIPDLQTNPVLARLGNVIFLCDPTPGEFITSYIPSRAVMIIETRKVVTRADQTLGLSNPYIGRPCLLRAKMTYAKLLEKSSSTAERRKNLHP
jgi:hypothetical protein